MSVLLGGGTGFIGRHLQKMLVDKGFKVTLISRKPKPSQLTWNDIKRNGLPAGCTAVVNLSGRNILEPFKNMSENSDYYREIYNSRIDTSRSLAEAIAAASQPPKVYATASGVGIYPPSTTAEYTEASPAGNDWLGKLAVDWEAAGDLPESVNTRRVVVRSGVVLGKDGGMIEQIKMIYKFGLGGKLGSGTQYFPWIHVKDMAGIFTMAIEDDNLTGVLNGVAPQISTNAEFTKVYAKAMNRPAWAFVPEFNVKLMFGSERAIIMLEGQKVTPERTLGYGYNYLYPTLESACQELVS